MGVVNHMLLRRSKTRQIAPTVGCVGIRRATPLLGFLCAQSCCTTQSHGNTFLHEGRAAARTPPSPSGASPHMGFSHTFVAQGFWGGRQAVRWRRHGML